MTCLQVDHILYDLRWYRVAAQQRNLANLVFEGVE